jgi:hypothetical protein
MDSKIYDLQYRLENFYLYYCDFSESETNFLIIFIKAKYFQMELLLYFSIYLDSLISTFIHRSIYFFFRCHSSDKSYGRYFYRIVNFEFPVAVFTIVNSDVIEVCGCCGRNSSNLLNTYSLRVVWISFIIILGDVRMMIVISKKI